jgi:sedoheptulokinase
VRLVGLDVGTTTICGVLLETDAAKILSVRTEPNSSAIPARAQWEALQEPDAVCLAVERILDDFSTAHGDMRAIGVTGQMHGILYVDREGRALSPLYTWQDGRGDQEMSPGKSFAAFLSDALGRTVSTGMGCVTHFYNLRKGLVPKNAAALCTIGDYVAMTLGHSQRPLMDVTNAASLGCFDLAGLRFAQDAMKRLSIDPGLFPQVSTAYPPLGDTRWKAPVFPALGDNQASFIGSVEEIPGSLLVNVGTGSQISLFSQTLEETPGVDIRPFPLGGSIAVGAALCGGSAYALLRSFFQETVRLFTGKADSVSWETMNAAEPAPGSAPLVVDTRFAGTRTSSGVRGSIGNIGTENFTPASLIAGLLDGIADELVGFYQRMPLAARRSVRRLVGSGNGIRRNPALRRAFEMKLGMPMRIPAHEEEASLGAALLAGVAAGIFPDLGAACALVRSP